MAKLVFYEKLFYLIDENRNNEIDVSEAEKAQGPRIEVGDAGHSQDLPSHSES